MLSDQIIGRHYELWKQYSESIKRWAFGTLLFSLIVLLRVIEPYTATTEELRLNRLELEERRREQALAQAEQAEADHIIARIENIYQKIGREPPWQKAIDDLKRELPRLGEAYRLLADMNPSDVAELVLSSQSHGLSAGRDQQDDMRSQTTQAHQQWQQWQDPESVSNRGRRREDPLMLKPLEPQDATKLLELRPDLLVNKAGKAYRKYLEAQVQHVAQVKAHDAITIISRIIDEEILGPIHRVVEKRPESAISKSLQPVVINLEDGMNAWRDALLQDSNWYKTVVSKDSAVQGLEDELIEYQNEFGKITLAERGRIKRKIDGQKKQLLKINEDVKNLEATTKQLSQTLEKALPEWVRGLVNPVQMIQLFPVIVLALVPVLAVKVYAARMYFVAVRKHLYPDRQDRRDASLSSIWSLVYRGAPGTALTALVFLAGTALLWWCFERGHSEAIAWLSNHKEETWEMAKIWLPRLKTPAKILFILCIGAVPAALVRDFFR